jgi:selenide,water dikinase
MEVAPGVSESLVALAHDPQTSGELLAAVPADRLAGVETALAAAGVPSWRVGRAGTAEEPGVALE